MPYIGNTPAEKYAAFNVQYFTTSATTSYTLDRAVANELDIRLVINNVIQEPGAGKAYTAAGTTLTLSGATSGGDTMYAVYIGKAVQTVNPGAGSVGTTALADNAVTEAKLNVSNSPVNGYVLSAQSGATGGLTWAVDAGGAALTGSTDNTVTTVTGANAIQGEANLRFDGTSLAVGNTNFASFDADAKNAVIGTGSGDNGATIYSDGSSSGSIFFANGTSGTQTKQGQIVYEQNNSALVFKTGATERQRIASNSIPAWHLIYSDNVSGLGSGSNAYTNSNMFSATYDFYRIYILNWEPQNDGVDMNLQFKLGGTTRTNNYRFNLRRNESNSAEIAGAYSNSGGSIRIMEGCGSGTSEVMSGFFEYQNPTGDNGNFYVTNAMYAGIETNGYTIGGVGQGSCSDSTGAMTGFTIAAHSGGLGNYNLRAYGLKTS